MSYDLFAFDLATAPADDAELLVWFEQQAEWSEPHGYGDPSVTTAELRNFYRELISTFPPQGGLEAPAELDEAFSADYAIGYSIVYVGLRYSVAARAGELFLRLGAKHGVGVCEISQTPPLIHRFAAPGDG